VSASTTHSRQFSLSSPLRNGTIVTSSVLGKIDVNCKLSGACLIYLNNNAPLSCDQEHPTCF
jgi:hypothetical protein